MKLKRFLLRYDPPGMGLEVDDGGTLEVRHKDLPSANEVTSEDILKIVDDLIQSEKFLDPRKHQASLDTLLGRLYKMEVPARESNKEKKEKAAPREPRKEEPAKEEPAETNGLSEGLEVCLIRLGGKLQQHNGDLGVISKVKEEKYEVRLNIPGHDPVTVKIKGNDNLVPVDRRSPFKVGTPVAIRGLRNHTALNGCLGRVVECHIDANRFEVRAMESGQLFRVKKENLVPIDIAHMPFPYKENVEPNTNHSARGKHGDGADGSHGARSGGGDQPVDGAEDMIKAGSTVQLYGLKTAMVYNGQMAEVIKADPKNRRYEIRLQDDSVKTIRAENVRFVSSPTAKGHNQSQGHNQSPRQQKRPKEASSARQKPGA